jgi:hypothetical protein
MREFASVVAMTSIPTTQDFAKWGRTDEKNATRGSH